MTGAQYLEAAIIASGKKRSFLATKCGLSRQYFCKKCKKPTSFRGNEIGALCEELRFTKAEKDKIFFAHDVE